MECYCDEKPVVEELLILSVLHRNFELNILNKKFTSLVYIVIDQREKVGQKINSIGVVFLTPRSTWPRFVGIGDFRVL